MQQLFRLHNPSHSGSSYEKREPAYPQEGTAPTGANPTVATRSVIDLITLQETDNKCMGQKNHKHTSNSIWILHDEITTGMG